MMLVVACCWLLMCQPASLRPDGIALPVTSLIYKSSPADQRPLSMSFPPNLCNETPTPYTSSASKSIASVNIPTKIQQESCIEQKPQPPFKTVSISTPLDPSIDKPLQIQSFTPNAAFIPQTLSLPQIDSTYFENSNFVNSNVGVNDCTQKLVPPVVQYKPSYVITSTDNCNNKIKIPYVSAIVDNNLPCNIHKVKIADSKPIYIDCSKPTKTYQIPSTLTPLNPLAIQSVEIPITLPKLEIVQNSITDNRLNQARESSLVTSKASAVLVENPMTSPNPNTRITQQQFINKATTEEKKTNIEAPAVTDKIVYPITNVVFSYGPNSFNQFQTACTNKNQPCSVVPPKFTPSDHKVGLELTPLVNAVPPLTQNNNKSPDNVNCCCKNMNLPLKPEPKCYFSTPTTSSSSCLFNEAYVPNKELPIVPIYQPPNVNTINKPPTRPPTLPSSIFTGANGYEITSDIFTSQLSCSLNNVISLLTTGLLSTVFGKSNPITSEFNPNIVTTESARDGIKVEEPVIDIATPVVNTDQFVSNPPFVSCPPSIDSPVVLPTHDNNLSSKEADSEEYTSVPSALCTQRAPKCNPYLASITINIMPSPDTTNDIIIVI